LAFDAAKSVAPPSSSPPVKVTSTQINKDDYVTKQEFRLFNVYLCIFAEMMDIFDKIDSSCSSPKSKKKHTTTVVQEYDGRITLEEWNLYCTALQTKQKSNNTSNNNNTQQQHPTTHNFKALEIILNPPTPPPPTPLSPPTIYEQIFYQMDIDKKEWCY